MKSVLEPCPGCGALFPVATGGTHPYIGASAGCWALFAPLSAGAEPDAALVAESRVPATTPRFTADARESSHRALLSDAYAVQHHGDDSPQAVQSVAVHLLALHGVLSEGHPVDSALWLRRRGLRRKGVFHKLAPPPLGSMLTVRHLFPGGGVVNLATYAAYAESVYAGWMGVHAGTVRDWYARFIVPD